MSADLLRRAAAKMRENAADAAAQSGPEWTCRVQTAGYAWLEPAHIGMHGYQSTARHIASWHPTVALAVARMLVEAADAFDHSDFCLDCFHPTCNTVGEAIAVARAYLGEDA